MVRRRTLAHVARSPLSLDNRPAAARFAGGTRPTRAFPRGARRRCHRRAACRAVQLGLQRSRQLTHSARRTASAARPPLTAASRRDARTHKPRSENAMKKHRTDLQERISCEGARTRTLGCSRTNVKAETCSDVLERALPPALHTRPTQAESSCSALRLGSLETADRNKFVSSARSRSVSCRGKLPIVPSTRRSTA